MTRKATDDGGRPVAFDLPWDFSAPVLDLTRHELVSEWARDETPATRTEKEDGVQPYEKFLADLSAGEATTETAIDMGASEDALYERFVEQSGMNDMLGRTGAGTAADLSAPPKDGAVETSGADAEDDDRLYRQFVEQSGMSWMLGDAGGGSADLSEGTEAGRQESLREQAEADELHESLRRQSHEDHFGGPSDASDDEMWERYRSALGQS